MAKGHRQVTETGPTGGGAPPIPSETRTTPQPRQSIASARNGSADARLSGDAARKAVTDALAIVPTIITRVELWKTDRLVPLERNPRTHSPERTSNGRRKPRHSLKQARSFVTS